MKKPKVLLKDIAKEANVSIATVSYVLSNQTDKGVSKEMSQKIKEIAVRLNYRPNQIAKSLQSGKTDTIGLVVADISNPFFSQIARIVEDEAKKHGYTVIFSSSDESARKSDDLLRVLMNRQVDGLIIAPAENSGNQLENLLQQGVPFVLIDRYFPGLDTNWVSINNYQAAYDATKRLLEEGHRSIALVAYKTNLQHMQDRIRGFQEAMSSLSDTSSKVFDVNIKEVEQEVRQTMSNIISDLDSYDAVIFATNTIGINGIKELTANNITIPNDLAVIVFDESDAFNFFYCPLSFVKQPIQKLAKQAVSILINQIKNPDAATVNYTLEAELIEGRSSEKIAR